MNDECVSQFSVGRAVDVFEMLADRQADAVDIAGAYKLRLLRVGEEFPNGIQ